MIHQLCVVGTVATEPKQVVTASGIAMCTFRLASSERRYDRGNDKWVEGDTNWFTVTAFRSLAEHATGSLQKGERVIVSGRLRIRQWERDGKQGTAVDIDADALGHDLRWGTTTFSKNHLPSESHSGTRSEGSRDESPSGSREQSQADPVKSMAPASTVPGGHWGDLSDNPPY